MAGKGRAVAAVLLLQAGQYTMDTWSTLNSSPWTGENVGADPEKLESLKRYCKHAALVSTAYCAGASIIVSGDEQDKQYWFVPILGAILNNAYLAWIYSSAVKRAKDAADSGKPNTWGMGNATVNEQTETSEYANQEYSQA